MAVMELRLLIDYDSHCISGISQRYFVISFEIVSICFDVSNPLRSKPFFSNGIINRPVPTAGSRIGPFIESWFKQDS